MSNRRTIIMLLFAIAFLAAALRIQSPGLRDDAASRSALLPIAPSAVREMRVCTAAYTAVVSRVTAPVPRWQVGFSGASPVAAAPETVMRLIDAFALTPIADALSESDFGGVAFKLSDFGLDPPAASLEFKEASGRRTHLIELGSPSASGTEVYARADGRGHVYALSSAVLAALPPTAGDWRPGRLLPFAVSSVSGIDIRVPSAPFVKLVRSAGEWRMTSPESAPALAEPIRSLVEKAAAVRIAAYVSGGAELPSSQLAAYGIDAEKGLAVTFSGPDGTERIVFGTVEEDGVYALVQGGTAVVKVPAEIAEACRQPADAYRDRRLFPFPAASVEAFSVALPRTVFILRRDASGWAIEAPVSARADEEETAAFLKKLTSLESDDAVSEGGEGSVTVKIGEKSAAVSEAAIGGAAALARLHTRRILALPGASVKRVTTSGPDRVPTVWPVAPEDPVPPAMISALESLCAERVVCVSADSAELAGYGLAKPRATIAVDIDSAESIRKNLLVGNALADGSSYVTLSASGTVFVLSAANLAVFGL